MATRNWQESTSKEWRVDHSFGFAIQYKDESFALSDIRRIRDFARFLNTALEKVEEWRTEQDRDGVAVLFVTPKSATIAVRHNTARQDR